MLRWLATALVFLAGCATLGRPVALCPDDTRAERVVKRLLLVLTHVRVDNEGVATRPDDLPRGAQPDADPCAP